MADYPRVFELQPIGEWPGKLTERREVANFRTPSRREGDKWVPAQRVPIGKTMRELATEFEALKAERPRLAIAVRSDQLTLDGRLRAREQPWHPGVILTFDSPRGVQRYPSDQYTHWEDNLRAIALTLNAMRGIERWGVGDVRASYLAIESGTAIAAVPFSHEPAVVLEWLAELVNGARSDGPRNLLRRAQALTHPDRGGDPDTFRLVSIAEGYLREANQL